MYVAIIRVGVKLKVVRYNFVRYNLASIVNRTRAFYSLKATQLLKAAYVEGFGGMHPGIF